MSIGCPFCEWYYEETGSERVGSPLYRDKLREHLGSVRKMLSEHLPSHVDEMVNG